MSENTMNEDSLNGSSCCEKNVGDPERIASAVGGGALALYGLSRRGWAGWALAAAGGALIFRGVKGHCGLYSKLGISTAEDGEVLTRDQPDGTSARETLAKDGGIKVEVTTTIDKPREEIFSFWRNFENLPKFMDHLEEVRITDDKHSHWIAKAPVGATVEWDAEITEEKENQLIAWRALPDADVPNSGSVHFTDASGGTEVKISLQYNPPGSVVGAVFARLFGEEPSQQVSDDLRRLKQLMETGAIDTSESESQS